MLLSGGAIRSSKLITDDLADNYRGGSYDLRIGTIIDPAGAEQSDYTLPAQGIVAVVSRETVTLPDKIAGFAMVKTSLCNAGVLAINIGIIDPFYAGPISSFLINFGKNPYPLQVGLVFLRLTFFEYEPDSPPALQNKSRQAYVFEKRQTVLQHFSSTFLDLRATTEDAAEKAFSKYKKALFFWVPALGLMFAVLTFLLNFGTQKTLQPADQTRVELLREQHDEQLRRLTDRVDTLQNEISALTNRTRAPGTKKK